MVIQKKQYRRRAYCIFRIRIRICILIQYNLEALMKLAWHYNKAAGKAEGYQLCVGEGDSNGFRAAEQSGHHSTRSVTSALGIFSYSLSAFGVSFSNT
jgi:hypothetical protein